jgi:hypothetical protein
MNFYKAFQELKPVVTGVTTADKSMPVYDRVFRMVFVNGPPRLVKVQVVKDGYIVILDTEGNLETVNPDQIVSFREVTGQPGYEFKGRVEHIMDAAERDKVSRVPIIGEAHSDTSNPTLVSTATEGVIK